VDHRGTLFIIATPLGNLDDLSRRARTTLEAVSRIACEDTRRTARLLARFGIDTPTLSCHRFNERERLDRVLARLTAGDDVALVSDSGTPGISDPGRRLVRAAVEAGIEVRPVPGPSAPVALLSVSGLPADRYVFEGFLPHRAGERRRRLRELKQERRPVVVFESPHRIVDALADIEEVLGDRPLVLGRELTKVHETILRGSARELRDRLGQRTRGEITLIIGGAEPGQETGAAEERREALVACWRRVLSECGGDRRAALKRAAGELGLKRAELYRRLAEWDEPGVQ
jgi:16S rRNA (cytidine1402-2'-O)-methyltransferase